MRLTGSSTTVLWRTGSRSDERPGSGQRRQRRRTKGPGEGDIMGQDRVIMMIIVMTRVLTTDSDLRHMMRSFYQHLDLGRK